MAKRRPRRTFTDDEKRNIVAEIEGGKRLVDAAAEYDIQASQLSQWKNKYGSGKKSASSSATRRRGRPKGSTASTSSASAPAATSAPAAAERQAASRAASTRNTGNTSSAASIRELEQIIVQLTVENIRLRNQLGDRG